MQNPKKYWSFTAAGVIVFILVLGYLLTAVDWTPNRTKKDDAANTSTGSTQTASANAPAPVAVEHSVTITEGKMSIAFGDTELVAMLDGPTTDYLCLNPLPDVGRYTLRYGVDSEVWRQNTKGHIPGVTFQAPTGKHKRVTAWLGHSEAECSQS